MPQNKVQSQEGLSLSDFIQAYGTEEKCLAALELARWPEGFHCPQCGESEKFGVIRDDRRKKVPVQPVSPSNDGNGRNNF